MYVAVSPYLGITHLLLVDMIASDYIHPKVVDPSKDQNAVTEPNTKKKSISKIIAKKTITIYGLMTGFSITLRSSEGLNPPIHKKNRSAEVFHIPDMT